MNRFRSFDPALVFPICGSLCLSVAILQRLSMRILALAFLALGLASVAAGQDVFTQKPAPAPSVVLGDAPKPPPVDVATADWSKAFEGGPTPLWLWGADQDKKYYLRSELEAKGVKDAKLKVCAAS